MKYASDNVIPVVARGSGTGLVGASVPIFGGIMINMSRMNKILEIDEENLMLTLEPGVLLMEISKYVEEFDLFYPPDPGEKSATIAGNINTNAGGMRAVKYGVTRDYIRGLEVVLPSGEILKVGGKVVKNSTTNICLEQGALDVFITDTDERKEAVWSARGAFLEAVKATTTYMDECDVVVPRNMVAKFINYTNELQKEFNIRIRSFGHAGDGNLHVYVLKDDLTDEVWDEKIAEVFEAMYSKSRELKGLVSGEHGIGFAKKAYMLEQLGPVYVGLMKNIKLAFDPKNILNPGKVCE